ncbi:MAG TPA: pyridoxamine 5'-phosphate oxidase family protein, partial [Chthoniobacterales bacterium]
YYGRAAGIAPTASEPRTPLDPDAIEFIKARDSFYIATVSETGWPYVQHRGGPAGFLRVLNPETVAFDDFLGNRQLLSTGNLAGGNDRVALFLMDYPQRTRLKIMGHARVLDAEDEPALAQDLVPNRRLLPKVERVFLIDVVSYDWNCPQYITPRYTEEEVARLIVAPLNERIRELEAQLSARAQ